MQSIEGNPLLPTKRLESPLNIETGYKKKSVGKHATLAETPRIGKSNPAAGQNRALRVNTGPRETFLDDMSPPAPPVLRGNHLDRGHEDPDSHDLSLSPRQVTRDSLVDHMLLSLDQFSFGNDLDTQPTVDEEQLYSSFPEDEHYSNPQNFAPRNGRGAHNYSYSSDYDQGGDEASRYSGQLSRGRRSNSSSNVQAQNGLGKATHHHIRNESIPSSTFNRGLPIAIPPRGIHSRSGKGSKGSSANSFDLGYAQITSNQRYVHGLPGRSSSFDFGDSQSIHSNAMSRQNIGTYSQLDYDAAPTPTVPGGPRRLRPVSPIMLPKQQLHHADSSHKLERKRSTRSSKSAFKSKASGGRVDYGLHDSNRELPPLPAFLQEQPAPAPQVGYGKSKSSSGPAPPSKDRPGFFRRVFGSSRGTPAVTSEVPHSHGSTTSGETTERPNSRTTHIANQIKEQQAPPPTPPKESTHLLTKKPSSFFRRRKKSVSEPEMPMPLPFVPPIRFQPENEGKSGQSPVSSLRKVMNPYLKNPGKSPLDPQHPQHRSREQLNDSPEPERHLRSFSPNYEPDNSATIRSVKHDNKNAVEGATSVPPTRKPPHSPASQPGYLGYDGQADDRDVTFLQDSSDNDPDSHSTVSKDVPPSREAPVSESTRPENMPPSDPSVARDMALVKEYERVYSKRSPTTAKPVLSSPALDTPSTSSGSNSSHTKKSSVAEDEDRVVLTPRNVAEGSKDKENRVWLAPSDSEDEPIRSSSLALPKNVAEDSGRSSISTDTVYKSATSLPLLQVEGEEETNENPMPKLSLFPRPSKTPSIEIGDVTEPQEEDRERAQKIYDGNEDFIQKDRAATWLGEEGFIRTRTLVAYMELYDFANINILAGLRAMCGRLVLRAESQQVDRILDAFARRWCQCNSNHGFKVTDVVHTICYSILLLNTDLHLADIDQKMTRSQFVKNTMPTIRRSVADAAPDAFEPIRPTVLPGKNQAFDVENPISKNLRPERSSTEVEKPSWRASFMAPARIDVDGKSPTPLDYETPLDDCGPLVKAPFHGTLRTWEVQVEIVLKDFYNSIRSERLPLFGAPIEKFPVGTQSGSTLSVFTNGVLRRTPSVISKAPSEAQSYARGRTADAARANTTKWANKNRSRPRLYASNGLASSRTSLDDQSSMWSPSVASSTWSKYSLGKTQTSVSVDSFGSSWQNGDFQQSIGFANAISQAIIREETTLGSNESATSEDLRVAPLLDDESLELAGAPWAKEGILKHKHHLESVGKRAKDRNWNEVFAVIEKGYMSLFSFTSKSMRNKSKGKAAGGVVGGGNWQENAESLGSFLLRQTIASALPSPGYSKARPHVWALSLPTGAVHLFQVGTPDIVKEFVSTANYWSARLSNHPLVGGISNIEYGWSDAIVNNALVSAINETERRPSTSVSRPSLQSSMRSSLDQGYSNVGHTRSRLPGDRITISDWTPPTQSMRSSNLMEPDQRRALAEYVTGIEEDLQKHNQLRSAMLLAFTPRHVNSQKAMANWEAKSSYLLHEIVKFRTYMDILQSAEASKQRVYAERAIPEIPVAEEDKVLNST